MDNKRQKSISGDLFSFPIPNIIPIQEHIITDFEFDCSTPGTISPDPYQDFPADHLFFNGRLLPHSFPPTPTKCGSPCALSRTSSISSKESPSLMSSRSTSTNSRNSINSSSDGSEKWLLNNRGGGGRGRGEKMDTGRLYITPVLAAGLKRDGLIRRKCNGGGGIVRKQGSDYREKRRGHCRRILRSFLLVCRECHAMEPSRKESVVQVQLHRSLSSR